VRKTVRLCRWELICPDISIGGGRLEAVDSFKYLVARITKDRRFVSEIKMRLAIAAGSLARLQQLWQSKPISTKSKVKLLRAVVISTILYGCGTWTLTAETKSRIQAFELRSYRRLLKISYKEHGTNQFCETK